MTKFKLCILISSTASVDLIPSIAGYSGSERRYTCWCVSATLVVSGDMLVGV